MLIGNFYIPYVLLLPFTQESDEDQIDLLLENFDEARQDAEERIHELGKYL